MTRRASRKGARRLMAIVASHSSASTSRNGAGTATPALATRTSIGPSAPSARSTSSAGASASSRSAPITNARRPPSWISRASSSVVAESPPWASTTAAPSALNARASARPMPPSAPVRSATRPSSGRSAIGLADLAAGVEDAFEAEDAAEDGDGGGVGRVHAVIGEPARPERAGLRVRRVGGVVDDPEVEGELAEVHRFVDRMAVDVGDLVHRVAERAGLHLHHGVGLAVVEVEVLAVLEKRRLDGHRALVVQAGPEDQERGDVVEREGVVEPV